jgi:hypothetical protein
MELTLESISQLGLVFFGLTSDASPQARAALFKQIHEIVFHGKGGYDWNTIYNMPIWLRKFTFTQIQNFYKEEEEAIKNKGKKGSQTVINSEGQVKAPEFLQKSQEQRTTPKPFPTKKPVSYK